MHFKKYFFLLIHAFTLSLIFYSCTKDKIQETNQNEKLGRIMFCTSSESGSIALKMDGAEYYIPSISDEASDEIFDDKKLADYYINSFPSFLLPEGYHTFIGGGEEFSFNIKTFVKAGSLRVYNLYTSESVLLSSVENKIFSLDCANIKNTGTLIVDEEAQGITSVISYTGGEGRPYNNQVISSTGVAGLKATLQAGTFANGNGSLTFTITGTPATSGTASFALNIAGKTCSINRNIVLHLGALGTLNCANATNNGTLNAISAASGVTSIISYTGGNGGSHNGQVVSSSGVTGLTAKLQAGNFNNGNGSLTYTITGTPATSGTASFALNIGGKTCTLSRPVAIATQNPTSGYGSNITDAEGNSYKTVYIGTQQWMGENLKTSKYSDGTTIPNITDNTQWSSNRTGAWCYYNNDATKNAKYGKLYNWYAVSPTTNGKKNVCPIGWHVPTDAEWTVLTDYLGGASVAGGKMKEVGTTSWYSPNTDAANISLFTGLPGGFRYIDGGYTNGGGYGDWWSSTENNTYNAWCRMLEYGSGNAYSSIGSKENGMSVRCLRD